MIYFLHEKPYMTSPRSSEENHGVDIRAINRRGEVKIKNQFGQMESTHKGDTKLYRKDW